LSIRCTVQDLNKGQSQGKQAKTVQCSKQQLREKTHQTVEKLFYYIVD